MRRVLVLCAATLWLPVAGCGGGGQMSSRTDGSVDRRDAVGDVTPDVGPMDLPQESRDGQDVRTGADTADAGGDADATLDVVDTTDVRGDVGDGPVDLVTDAIADGVDAADVGSDAVDVGAGDAEDAVSDTGTETGRPYVERDCTNQDACVCASNESCKFACPGGACSITCAAGSNCTVTCASPFSCSVSCGNGASCVLACNLGVCFHFIGPASTLACDPVGLGCI